MAKYADIKGKGLLFILFFWLLWFTNYTSRTIFSPIMPLIEDEFAITHARASSLFTFTSIGYGISLFVSGIFAGFFGYKKSILLSLGISALVLFLIPQTKFFSQLTVLAFIFGMAVGVYIPSIIPLMTEYYEEKSWGRAIGVHDTAASLSVFAAPLIALFLLKFFNWRGIFYVFGVVYGICGILFFFACKELKVSKTQKGYIGSILRSKSFWVLGILWIFASGTFLAVYLIVPLYLTKELSFDIGYANTLFAFSRLGGVFASLTAGFIVGRFSLKKIMFTIIFVSGVLTLFISHWNTRVVEVALFLQGSIIAGFFPLGLVSISKVFAIEKRGMATGFIGTLAAIFGCGLFPYLLGLAGDFVSFRFGIFAFGILIILSSGIVYFLKELE